MSKLRYTPSWEFYWSKSHLTGVTLKQGIEKMLTYYVPEVEVHSTPHLTLFF